MLSEPDLDRLEQGTRRWSRWGFRGKYSLILKKMLDSRLGEMSIIRLPMISLEPMDGDMRLTILEQTAHQTILSEMQRTHIV